MGEGEAEGGTVFCLKEGEEDVVFPFLFFSCAVYSQGVGHSSSSSSTSFEFFFGYHFFCCLFALYRPSKLETAYHHTHTLSLSPVAFNFFFFLFSDPVSIVSKERKKNSSILRSCRHVI